MCILLIDAVVAYVTPGSLWQTLNVRSRALQWRTHVKRRQSTAQSGSRPGEETKSQSRQHRRTAPIQLEDAPSNGPPRRSRQTAKGGPHQQQRVTPLVHVSDSEESEAEFEELQRSALFARAGTRRGASGSGIEEDMEEEEEVEAVDLDLADELLRC